MEEELVRSAIMVSLPIHAVLAATAMYKVQRRRFVIR